MKTILKKFAAFLCAALVLCACSDDDYSEAHQTLMALIRQAESLVEESTEGIEEGDTAPGSKKALQARIDQAYYLSLIHILPGRPFRPVRHPHLRQFGQELLYPTRTPQWPRAP